MGEIVLDIRVFLALHKSHLPDNHFFYTVTTNIYFQDILIRVFHLLALLVVSYSFPLLGIIISSNYTNFIVIGIDVIFPYSWSVSGQGH